MSKKNKTKHTKSQTAHTTTHYAAIQRLHTNVSSEPRYSMQTYHCHQSAVLYLLRLT